MIEESLRDRKKRETRLRLHHAALDLAARDGLHVVTVEAIAAQADVSPRTFFNYFPTKEAAVVGASADFGDRLATALAARPAHESIPTALRVVLTEHLVAGAAEPRVRERKRRLMLSHPELAAAMTGMTGRAQDALTSAVAERLGVDGEHDPYPRLAVRVAFAAVATALSLPHSPSSGPEGIRADLERVFGLLDACVDPLCRAAG